MSNPYADAVTAAGFDLLWDLNGLVDTHPDQPDATGNGNDAQCFDVADHQHGIASPIESDEAGFAIAQRVLRFTPTGGVDRLNTFAWIMFGHAAPSGSPKVIFCRSGQVNIVSSNIVWINEDGDTVHARLRIGTTNYLLSVACVPNTWPFIAVTYNAGVIQLRVNIDAFNEETGVAGDMDVAGEDEMFVGAQHSLVVNSNTSLGVDGVAMGAFVNVPALRAIYESAFNSTFLNGVSNVIPTSILDGADEDPPIHFPLRHNWTTELIERISFKTQISQAISGPEEARSVRPKPRREIEIHQLVRDNSERRALRAKLWANQHRQWFIPILEDREVISALESAATVIPVSTAFKNYEIGGYVQVRQLNEFGQITQSENLQISAFNEDGISLASSVENDYEGHVEVCPAHRGYINVSSARGHTAEVEDLVVTARLLAEDEKVVPSRITSLTPALEYFDHEVFVESTWQSNDWSELRDYEIGRTLVDIDSESGLFGLESDTPGNQEAFSYRIWIKGRELNSSFLGWFYERAGSSKYLWVPSMQRDFEPLSIDSDEVLVKDTHYTNNYAAVQARRDLAFVYNDGSMILRRIEAFQIDGANEILTLDESDVSLANLRSLSLLKFCRLDADTLEIAKRTDDIWIYAWRFRELLSTPE